MDNKRLLTVKSTVRLFADDCLLYREIRSFEDHLLLQEDLHMLEKWAEALGIKFNAQKCYILPTKARSSFFYSLGGEASSTRPKPWSTYLR